MAAQKTTTDTAYRTYLTIKGIAYGMFALGLGLSVTHIFDLFRIDLGSTLATALAVPVFIDGMQLVGRLIRGESFAEGTRTAGKWLQGFGAAASLTANLWAGHSIGDKIGGAIFVVGYIVIEMIAEVIRPAAEDTSAVEQAAADAAKAARTAAAQKAAVTRKANAAKKAQQEADRKERQRLNRLASEAKAKADKDFAAATLPAPVSPAPIDYTAIAYI